MELTKEQIVAIAKIAEQHGSEIIETYLFGDRDKGELVWIWDRKLTKYVNLFVYPWLLDNPEWDNFYIGKNPNDSKL